MRRLELWRWRYFDPVRKRNVTTRYVMSEADAKVEHADAVKVDGSLEVRQAPETDDEIATASTSAFQRNSTCPICRGARWVCEDHPEKAWEHDGCGGAGAPCACNPKGLWSSSR
jgi:hypothetical protein